MSIIEGAPFRCDIHEFETDSLDEWNNHCFGNPEHVENGETACSSCGTKVFFTDLPFVKMKPDGTKVISLLCEKCETHQMGQVKRSKQQ